MSKKTMPPLVKAQSELYTRKLNRALKVSANLKKLDASFKAFSEALNPDTGEPHADNSMPAKVKRVNTWLKNFDREYWNNQFSNHIPRPKQFERGSPSGRKIPAEEAVFTRKDVQKSIKTISYWVCSPENSTKKILTKDEDEIVEIQFSELVPQRSADTVVSILLEINVVGGAIADKGRVAILEKSAEVKVDYLLGSPYETINLVSGVNKVNLRSMKDTEVSISTLLNERKVCIFRSDESSSFYIRKWANFLQEIPSVLPICNGKTSTIVLT
nr:coat protein [Black mulberry idaeovirus]